MDEQQGKTDQVQDGKGQVVSRRRLAALGGAAAVSAAAIAVTGGKAQAGTAQDTGAADAGGGLPALEQRLQDANEVANGRVSLGQDALASLPDSYTLAEAVVAIGDNALQNCEKSTYSIAIGPRAMMDSKVTQDNIGIGVSALQNVQAASDVYDQDAQQGSRNVAIGGMASYFLNDGSHNVHIGRNAGSSQVSGQGVTAIGANALGGYAPTGLDGNIENVIPWGTGTTQMMVTAVGADAAATSQVSDITAVGAFALEDNKRGSRHAAFGARAAYKLEAPMGLHGGSQTTLNVSGTYSQSGTTLSITITSNPFAVGDWAQFQLLTGPASTFQNDAPWYQVTSVSGDTFTITSPATVTGTGNALVVTWENMASPVTPSLGVTALGSGSFQSLTYGEECTAIGMDAGWDITSATESTVVGADAGGRVGTSSQSTMVGTFSGYFIPDAQQVTALGANALRNASDGSELTQSWANITGIGYGAAVSGPNQVQLGNSSTSVYTYGAVQNRSDARDKTDVRDTALGLDFINALRPVDYRWNLREGATNPDYQPGTRYHHGVLAQDIETLISTGMIEDFGGFQDHQKSGGIDVMSVGYTEFIGPLIKAVQELSGQVEDLKGQLAHRATEA